MSEQIEDAGINEAAPAPQASEAEARAREQGWVPKEEWNGEGKWRDAESFLDRGELFSKIDAQRREMKELRKSQQDFAKHLDTVRQTEYKRALDALRKEKKDALLEGDADAVILADEKIAAVREAATAVAAQPVVAQPGEAHPEFIAWTNKNPWYNTHAGMRGYAEAIAAPLIQRGLDPQDVLKEVEREVRKEFPNRFTNPNRDKPGAVEGGAGKGNASGKDSYPLTEAQRTVMNRLVKSGALTKEQYIADLKAADARFK